MNAHTHGGSSGGIFQSAINWFAGDGAYMNLVHCMGHDYLWIGITVTLDFAVAAGYMLIAKHWWKNERTLPDIPARRALASMRNIFLFCGICGYLFIPIKMLWPAWRLYDLVMVALVYFTWRYAMSSTSLKVIYAELGKGSKLAEELEVTREQSSRKTFFLNAISHDLRTPLNGLVLQASLADLSAETGDRDGLRQAVHDMKASARTAADMLDSLLEYARMDLAADPHHVTHFSLADVMLDVIELHRPIAVERKLSLRGNCPVDVYVATDRQKLQRVLSNLVSNALKFTHTGGVRIEVAHGANAVEIHVIDTGVGIGPADRERLFEEFFQVHNHERDRRKGFGLGLAIARRLARQLGGDIAVESAPGQGSRFTVALAGVVRDASPAINGEHRAVAVTANYTRLSVEPRSVLVVEDDPISAQALRILLRRHGWKVDVVGTISDANAYLDTHCPQTIILDLMLPDGDGSAVLRRVRQQALGCRVTVTTATADIHWIERVRAMRPDALLKKPIELAELLRAME